MTCITHTQLSACVRVGVRACLCVCVNLTITLVMHEVCLAETGHMLTCHISQNNWKINNQNFNIIQAGVNKKSHFQTQGPVAEGATAFSIIENRG